MDVTKYYKQKGEKPLDNIVSDGGMTAIFRTIACVGDSLSSGEFQILYDKEKVTERPSGTIGFNEGEKFNTAYYDKYEYSWGQFIARMTGAKVYNFSCGGLSAHVFNAGWGKEHGAFDLDKKAQAYIIAFGQNDLFGAKKEVGTMADVDLSNPENNKDTFAGHYAKLICNYKKIAPNAKFFLVTFPKQNDEHDILGEKQANLLIEMAKAFDNTYVLDLYHYAPVYDKTFRDNFYLNSHLTPTGYLFTAKIIASYIDYIIRNNPDDFKFIGMIDDPHFGDMAK